MARALQTPDSMLTVFSSQPQYEASVEIDDQRKFLGELTPAELSARSQTDAARRYGAALPP